MDAGRTLNNQAKGPLKRGNMKKEDQHSPKSQNMPKKVVPTKIPQEREPISKPNEFAANRKGQGNHQPRESRGKAKQ